MRVTKKFVKLTTDSDGVNAAVVPANFAAPANYTATDSFIKGHLTGIDNKFGVIDSITGDIGHTSFVAADNQSSAADVTGLTFANGSVRAFEAILSIVRDSTYATYKLLGIQKAASWEMSQDFVGDTTGLTFSITTAGQVQYTSTSTGFTATVKFRAKVTSV